MGSLRFLFTLTIILGHIYSIFGFRYHELLSSPIAFESFFVLSGFSITLVLGEKYGVEKQEFFRRRLIRIFPMYWLILLLTLCFSSLSLYCFDKPSLLMSFVDHWVDLNPGPKLWIVFTNVFIAGQEAFYFFKFNFNTGGWERSVKFIDGDPAVHTFLFVSQAWAISYMIYFYLLAGWLNRLRSRWLILIALTSLSSRFFAYSKGYQFDPWLYRFFPFELFFFMAGMLSCRMYFRFRDHELFKRTGLLLWVILILASLFYDAWKTDYLIKQWLFYALLIVALPAAFNALKKYRTDRLLGDLAYPMYISNFLIINMLMLTDQRQHSVLMISIVFFTLLFSLILQKGFQEPLERWLDSKRNTHAS